MKSIDDMSALADALRRTGRQTVAAWTSLLLLSTPALAQQADSARSVPYSRLTIRVGATHSRTAQPLHTYYPGNNGIAFEVETPFEFGLLGIAVDAVTYRGATAQQVTTSTNTLALDWRKLVRLTDRIDLRPGIRIGDFHMVFQDPAFKLPNASPDHGTEEFLIGPTAALDFHLTRSLSATVVGSWVYLPSATPMKITALTLLGGYSVGTPAWLQHFLQ